MGIKTAAALRLEVESALAGRVVAPFQFRERRLVETAPTGVAEVDALTGGLPRGGLTEIFGPVGAGKTSLLMAALAERTTAAEACALVDARDAFDPEAAGAAGVRLERLLWVRCREISQAMRATDLLIQGGGFGLIAVDLSDIAPRVLRHVPLNVWFRWRRAVEETQTILLVMEPEANAKTCASLVLRMEHESALWTSTAGDSRQTEARLLAGRGIRVERVRARRQEGILMRRMDGVEMEEDSASFEASVVRLCGEINAETQRAQRKKRLGKHNTEKE
jgi:recombination protein RecA